MSETPVWVSLVIQALATLVGAYGAFELERYRRRQETLAQQADSFRTAIFVLVQQRAYLRNLDRQRLQVYRDEPRRAYFLTYIHGVEADSRVDVGALSFILGTKDAELVGLLANCEAQYRTAVSVLNRRNESHVQFQLKVQHVPSEILAGADLPAIEDLRGIAGPMLSRILEQQTETLYRSTCLALRGGERCIERAHTTFKAMFPGEPLFGITDATPEPESDECPPLPTEPRR